MLKKAKQIFRGVCKKILRKANWGKKALAATLAVVIMAGMLPSMGLTVNAASDAIAVSSIASPTNIGLAIPLTATITGGSNPTGTVTFNNNGVSIGSTTTISSGVATISYTPTTMESLSITADYSGDGNNTPAASGAQTATVSQATPSLSIPIATPASPQTYPVSVTLSSTLSNYYGTISGQTVAFYSGETVLGSGTTNDSGVVTFTWSNPGASAYSITARFAGDTNNSSVTSNGLVYNVNLGTQSALLIGGVPSTVTYGDSTFTLSPTGGSGTGAITYSSDNTSVLTVNSSGVVTIADAGSATITVTKAADANYNSISKDVSITVVQKILTATITPNNKSYDGLTSATVNSISLIGKVGSDDVSFAGGTIAFNDKTAADGKTVTITSGYNSLTGVNVANYTLGTVNVNTANITKATLTVTNTTVNGKTYDDNLSATFSGTPTLSGVINDDDVTLSDGVPTFESKDYSASAIPVDFSSFGISGADAANYSLTQPSPVSAMIMQRTLNVTVTPVTILCGQTIPALTVNISGFASDENETNVTGFVTPTASQSYGSTTTPVTNASMAVTYTGGNATNNYQFSYAGTVLLTIQAVNINNGDYQVEGNYSTSANPPSWNSSDLTITPINGYDEISVDESNWLPSLSVTTEATNGSVTFKLRNSSDGLQSEDTTIYYNLDKTAPAAPSIEINGVAPEGASEWYGGATYPAITITPQAFVIGTAPETTYYKLWKNDDTEPGSGTVFTGAQPAITSDGVWNLTVWAADAAGNSSADTTTTINEDTTAPTGTITIQNNDFSQFLNTITFGLFFKQTVDVTIAGADTLSGVKTIEYQKVATQSDYNSNGPWTSYSNKFSVSPDEKFIVYAKITDNAGNETIINSNGVVVYTYSSLATSTPVKNPDTGDHSPVIPLALLGSGSFATALYINKRRIYRIIVKK